MTARDQFLVSLERLANRRLTRIPHKKEKVAVYVELFKPLKNGHGDAGYIYDIPFKTFYYLIINKPFYDKFKTKEPDMIKNMVLHELAHIPQLDSGQTKRYHDNAFKETAKKLGVPESFNRAKYKKPKT